MKTGARGLSPQFWATLLDPHALTCRTVFWVLRPLFMSADLQGTGKLLRIRPEIFDFETDVGLRHITIPNDSGRRSETCKLRDRSAELWAARHKYYTKNQSVTQCAPGSLNSLGYGYKNRGSGLVDKVDRVCKKRKNNFGCIENKVYEPSCAAEHFYF